MLILCFVFSDIKMVRFPVRFPVMPTIIIIMHPPLLVRSVRQIYGSDLPLATPHRYLDLIRVRMNMDLVSLLIAKQHDCYNVLP